ncbi:MAG: GNAT family N-acetyltransferase [Oscillospiraceae bacterium]|nr:GNAT family N-acetyltransferase [Oscillospiraceae bacterium]
MLTNSEILNIAMRQSAMDVGCEPDDFLKAEPVIVESAMGEQARKYYSEPIVCNLVSYGNNVVAMVKPESREVVSNYVSSRDNFHSCFETPNMHILSDSLKPLDAKICFMAEYFLPDVNRLKALSCKFETRILVSEDFRNLYIDKWRNALCEKRRELDVLGVGAYDKGELVALAGCSADCDSMWQIGIDVLPEYRRQGVASALTSRLAVEILAMDKVPFYCCAWSNIPSARNAIRSGFAPSWVEMTAKPSEIVDNMNKE